MIFSTQKFRKSIESFVVCGNYLLAIDNILETKYGWLFKFDTETGEAQYSSEVRLGSGIYLSYYIGKASSKMVAISGSTSSGYVGRRKLIHFFKPVGETVELYFTYEESTYHDMWKKFAVIDDITVVVEDNETLLIIIPGDKQSIPQSLKGFSNIHGVKVINNVLFLAGTSKNGTTYILLFILKTVSKKGQKSLLKLIKKYQMDRTLIDRDYLML